MPAQAVPGSKEVTADRPKYAWLVLAISALMMGTQGCVYYSYSVFFKPLAEGFGWNRSETSGVFSVFLLSLGVFAMINGWAADKYGPRKVLIAGAVIAGGGLLLTSQISELWQLYLAYGFIAPIGLSCNFTLTNTMTARWFEKGRGMALGVVSSGTGLGVFLGVPMISRIIESSGWSLAYVTLAIFSGTVIGLGAIILKWPAVTKHDAEQSKKRKTVSPFNMPGSRKPLFITFLIYLFLYWSYQSVMVHLVNYATDIGIDPLTAAGVIGILGIVSIMGRLGMGAWADRIGTVNVVSICCAVIGGSLVWLMLGSGVMALYVFVALFGIGFGGEVPQMAPIIGRFYGLKSTTSLVGMVVFAGQVGGAFGTWLAGAIFDATHSYHWAFVISAGAAFLALGLAIWLNRQPRINTEF